MLTYIIMLEMFFKDTFESFRALEVTWTRGESLGRMYIRQKKRINAKEKVFNNNLKTLEPMDPP